MTPSEVVDTICPNSDELNTWQAKTLSAISEGDVQQRMYYEVGYNRQLVSLIAPLMIPECKTAVLFVEPMALPHVRELAENKDIRMSRVTSTEPMVWTGRAKQPDTSPWLVLMSSARLSKPDGLKHLRNINPDLVIYDEEHFTPGTARQLRLDEYLKTRPGVRSIAWKAPETLRKPLPPTPPPHPAADPLPDSLYNRIVRIEQKLDRLLEILDKE